MLPNKILHELNKLIKQVYFLLRGIISLANLGEDRLIAEIAMVSNGGAIEIAVFLGGNIFASLAITQTDCTVVSLPVNIWQRKFALEGELQRILLLYAPALLTQVSQNVFCSSYHTVRITFRSDGYCLVAIACQAKRYFLLEKPSLICWA